MFHQRESTHSMMMEFLLSTIHLWKWHRERLRSSVLVVHQTQAVTTPVINGLLILLSHALRDRALKIGQHSFTHLIQTQIQTTIHYLQLWSIKCLAVIFGLRSEEH